MCLADIFKIDLINLYLARVLSDFESDIPLCFIVVDKANDKHIRNIDRLHGCKVAQATARE